MGQLGFFDADKRLQALSARGDPLEAIDHLGATLFWRAETGAAWEFHGSDGSAGAPRVSIHLSRCGLAFTPFVSGETPVASWCSMVQSWCSMVQRCDSETSLRVLRVTCNAGDERCRP
jgi:hypothetical protein